MRAATVEVELYDANDRAVKVRATYSPPTRDYFSASFGNWLPGDGESVEVLDVRAVDEGANVAEVEADRKRVEEAVRLAVNESGPDDDDAYDRRGDR